MCNDLVSSSFYNALEPAYKNIFYSNSFKKCFCKINMVIFTEDLDLAVDFLFYS